MIPSECDFEYVKKLMFADSLTIIQCQPYSATGVYSIYAASSLKDSL